MSCDNAVSEVPIVYVFPEPVWPYAITVTLYPWPKGTNKHFILYGYDTGNHAKPTLNTSSTKGLAVPSNSSSWSAGGGNALSNLYLELMVHFIICSWLVNMSGREYQQYERATTHFSPAEIVVLWSLRVKQLESPSPISLSERGRTRTLTRILLLSAIMASNVETSKQANKSRVYFLKKQTAKITPGVFSRLFFCF